MLQATDENQSTALHDAATYNEIGVAKLLLQSGAKLDLTDKEGGTPLHNACMREDNTEMIKLLVSSTDADREKVKRSSALRRSHRASMANKIHFCMQNFISLFLKGFSLS